MNKMRFMLTALAAFALTITFASAAQAVSFRTFVRSNGGQYQYGHQLLPKQPVQDRSLRPDCHQSRGRNRNTRHVGIRRSYDQLSQRSRARLASSRYQRAWQAY